MEFLFRMGSSPRKFPAVVKGSISQWCSLQVTFKKHSLCCPVTWEVSPALLNRKRDNCIRAELPKLVFNPDLAASICHQSLFCECFSKLALQQKGCELHNCVVLHIFPNKPGTWDSSRNLFMCIKRYHCWQNSSRNWGFLKSISTG